MVKEGADKEKIMLFKEGKKLPTQKDIKDLLKLFDVYESAINDLPKENINKDKIDTALKDFMFHLCKKSTQLNPYN